MSAINFQFFSGYVTNIEDFMTSPNDEKAGCYKLISVDNGSGSIVNFIAEPTTYFVDQAMIRVGDWITGYYDGDAPVPLIYPPQYRAIIIVKENPFQSVKVDFFNSNLESSDGQLKLNISPSTQIVLTNGQAFSNNIANRNLIVIYTFQTMSIPAQTSPLKIIVLC